MSATRMRRQNLAAMLELLHVDGPLTRATLTEATGLNRSTIGDLVAGLVGAGLVEERAPDAARRAGRPSPVVAITAQAVAIAANPEVDAMTVAAIALDRTVLVRERMPWRSTPTPENAAAMLAERIKAWRAGALSGHRIVGAGIAVPGLVRADDGVVRDAPHLRWRDVPLASIVTAATGLPTTVGNDASLGARAEHLFGAARGTDDVVYLNGGASGIGGGIIAHGTMIGGSGGYAGEFGQNRPGIEDAADRRVPGGGLEDEVSRARLVAAVTGGPAGGPGRTGEQGRTGEPNGRAGERDGRAGERGDTSEPHGRAGERGGAGRPHDTGEAGPGVRGGDPAPDDAALAVLIERATAAPSVAEVERQRRILATALANAVNVLNPTVVVLGGFLAALTAGALPELTAAVRAQAMPACGEDLEVRLASLAEDRLLIGAAELAFAPLLADPLGA